MPENCPSGKAEIEQRLTNVVERVRAAERQYGREPGSVAILAVSKTHSASEIAAVAALGVGGIGRAFGESYVQEAQEKITRLADLGLQWHFIGPLQSNKTPLVARLFQWVHSVDRAKIAQRLNDQRPDELPPLELCLQVNVSGEASKSGVTLEELPALAECVASLPRLRLRGLMAIPAATRDVSQQRAAFAAVREAFNSLKKPLDTMGLNLPTTSSPRWDTLSMGMSGDLEAAIAEGSTIVRVGTAIFGPRLPSARSLA